MVSLRSFEDTGVPAMGHCQSLQLKESHDGLGKGDEKTEAHYLANRSQTDCSRLHRIAELREQTSDLSIVFFFELRLNRSAV